jgi:enterochelin esterase-like enzyme
MRSRQMLRTLILLTVCSFSIELPARAQGPAWVTPAVRAPRVTHHSFESSAIESKVSFHVYTPEVYGVEKQRRFPVLYWLHGTGGGLAGIAPVSAWFDTAIQDGKMPPVVVVFPNGLAASMWCDSKDGAVPMETIVVKELVPHIDATFRTIAKREGRIIEGFSMGGYGAARLGLKFPEVFAAVSCLAGGPLDLNFQGPRTRANPTERENILRTTFGGDLDYFRAQSPLTLAERQAAAVQGKLIMRVAVGSRDFTAALNREFSTLLKKLGIAHTYLEVPGVGHETLPLLRGLGAEQWPFYRSALAPISSKMK